MDTLHIACPKRADDPARHLDVHVALPLLIEAMGFVGEHFCRCVCGAEMLIIAEPAAPGARREGA